MNLDNATLLEITKLLNNIMSRGQFITPVESQLVDKLEKMILESES